MNLITERHVISTVAERWKRQYCNTDGTWFWLVCKTETSEVTYLRLLALDLLTARPVDVMAIIGNGSWVRLTCNECGRNVDAAVILGEPLDFDSETASVCQDCLRAALALFPAE